jgi:hypothetical protein
MRELSTAGMQALAEIARRNGFSLAATRHMLDAVIRGDGSMAQFDHPEFAGPGQWMRGGMTMVSNLFDNDLKSWVDALCLELANLVAREPALFREAPSGGLAATTDVPRATARFPRSGDWWPAGMGHPNSAGAQNGMRYAYFARARRLAIERDGALTLYDTGEHEIRGIAQQQSLSGALRFSSAQGPVDLASLPVVTVVEAQAPSSSPIR